jgi:hypothetical protein
MAFQLPEDLSQLSIDELEALHAEGLAAARDIAERTDEDLTDDDIASAETIMAALETLATEVDTRTAAAEARTARLEALREATAPVDTVEEPEEVVEDVPTDEETVAEEAPVPVVAAARVPVSRVARRAPAVVIPEPEPEPQGARLVAAANVPGYDTSAELVDLDEVAKAFMNRARGFQGSTAQGRFDRYGVARIQKPENEFAIHDRMSAEDQMSLVMEAAKESRLPKGGLIAAGGWCAPSEVLYDFCQLEVVDGLISVPEIQVPRGGIKFTKGPDFAALSQDWGFLQTEAEAEAGTVKVCYEVDCPPFTEVRLDAIGFCITAGILTNAAWPEMVRRVLELGALAHARKVNAEVVKRISAALGTAVNYTESTSTTADILDAISLNATITRAKYSLGINATLEVILPYWAKELVRADLSRRTGVENMLGVTDAQIQSWFSVRNLAPQWINDYQPIPTSGAGNGQAWPTTLEVLIYPAGAFVKGTTDVIDLDTVYDSTGLSTNTYTAAFFEEGLLVANTCAGGVKVAIDVSCLKGVTGAAELSCIATP